MDDRNPLSYEQVQQKLADSRTLDGRDRGFARNGWRLDGPGRNQG